MRRASAKQSQLPEAGHRGGVRPPVWPACLPLRMFLFFRAAIA
jgi:hypothetical protein